MWQTLSNVIACGIQQHEEGKPSLVWDTFGSHNGHGLNDGRLLLHIAELAGVKKGIHYERKFQMYVNAPFHESHKYAMRGDISFYCEHYWRDVIANCPEVAAEYLKAINPKKSRYREARHASCVLFLRCLMNDIPETALLFQRRWKTKTIAYCLERLIFWGHDRIELSDYSKLLDTAPRIAAALKRHYGKVATLKNFLWYWHSPRRLAWFRFFYEQRPDPSHRKWILLVLYVAIGYIYTSDDDRAFLLQLIPPNSYTGKIRSITKKGCIAREARDWFLLNVSHPSMREEHRKQF